MRCFLALNLPSELRVKIAIIQREIKSNNIGMKATWVRPDLTHINLVFLDELSSNEVNILKAKLPALKGKYGIIKLSLSGIDAFPNIKNPHIIFLGVKEKFDNKLILLEAELKKIVSDLKITIPDRRFTPHVTLSRIKKQAGQINLLDAKTLNIFF